MVIPTYGAEEARTRLPELMEQANAGRSVLITRRGRAYAALVPPDQIHDRHVPVLGLRGSGAGLWDQAGDSVAALRDEWE
jgi:prevent-host-death family protein